MISIIEPVYNAANYIEETIKTVVNQTYQDWSFCLWMIAPEMAVRK